MGGIIRKEFISVFLKVSTDSKNRCQLFSKWKVMPLRSCLIKYVLTNTGNQGHSILLSLVITRRAYSPKIAINL